MSESNEEMIELTGQFMKPALVQIKPGVWVAVDHIAGMEGGMSDGAPYLNVTLGYGRTLETITDPDLISTLFKQFEVL